MSLNDMQRIFVEPFENKDRREQLLSRFQLFLNRLNEIPIKKEIWVDGSFATNKVNPSDIDLVVICNQDEVNNQSQEAKESLRELFSNQQETKLRYECDAYFIVDDLHDKSYWRGLFGFDRNEKPKGIAKLIIEATA